MIKAYAYLRVSGVNQIEGDGFERQRIAIEKYAIANGIELKNSFQELGISGTKDLDDRPALQRLLLALEESSDVKTIIVERLDRLARDLMIQESLLADLNKRGYTLISATEPDLCSGDPSRTLMRQMLGAFAQYERTMIVQKLRGARERTKAKTGRCEGQKPFGHYLGEDMTMEYIRMLIRMGSGPFVIASKLNQEPSHKTRSGKPWNPKVIARILKRELDSTKKDAVCA